MIKNLQKPRAMRATLFILLLIVAGMTKAFAYSGTGDYFGTLDSQTSYYPDATVTANNCTFLMPNYDVDVVAEYAMNPPFTVSFNPGTGSCDIESLTETGSHSGVILPTATPSANCADHGYTFQGWAKFFVEETRVSPDLYSAGELYYPSENTTLFAVYAVEATDWREITELSEFMEGDYIIATEYNQNLYYLPFNGATSSVTIPKMKLNANGEPTTSPALQPGQPLAPTHLWTIAKMNDTQYSITHRQDSVTYYLKSYKDGVWSIQVTVYEPTSGWVMSQHSTKGLRLCFPNPQADPTKEVRYLDRGVSYWANHPDYDYVGKIHLFLSPSIAYCTAPVCMNVTAPDYITQYFTLESLVDDNTITFHIPHDITSELLTSVSYSTDGINWLTLTIDDTDQSIVVNLDTDEKVYFKGIGAQYGIDEDIDEFNNPNSHFEATGDFKAYGNTMSLFYGDDFYFQFHGEVISQLHFPSFVEEIAIEPEYVFCGLFYGNTHLVSAEHMVLPAVNLGEYPYCYTSMFSGCTSLTTAPELPATSLSEGCYSSMFSGCTSLTTAPELPATSLSDECYYEMFKYCSMINSITCMAIDISAPNCTNNWLSGVASTGTFTKASGMTDWPNGFPYGIPQGWTVESLDVFINEGNWNEDSNWSANSVPTDGSNVVIAANVTIPSDYVANAGEININSGKTLTIVDGGQLIHTNAVNATLQKTISAYSDQQGVTDGWYTIASPVTGNYSTESLTVGNYDLYLYHEPTHTWWNSKGDLQNGHGFNTLANGKGYLYANAAEKTLAFVGETPATNATVNMPLSYTEAADNLKGFNLVGNPFTRNLTAADGIKIGETDLTTYYYVAGESELQTTTLAERDIKPGEGFFVQAETANQDIAINTSNSGRKKGADYAFVCIEAGNDIFMDRAYIQIGDGNSLRKMSLNDRTPKISVMNDGKDYAAASIDAVQGEIPVHFEPAENGTYILRVKTMYLESDYLHLVDNLTGNDIDLLQTPTYTFEARTSDYASRFKLVFNAQHGDVDGNEGFAFFSNGELVVNGTGTIQIIDVAGRQLFNREINSAFRIPHSEFSPGVYLLRLVNGECVRTQKIVLNK